MTHAGRGDFGSRKVDQAGQNETGNGMVGLEEGWARAEAGRTNPAATVARERPMTEIVVSVDTVEEVAMTSDRSSSGISGRCLPMVVVRCFGILK